MCRSLCKLVTLKYSHSDLVCLQISAGKNENYAPLVALTAKTELEMVALLSCAVQSFVHLRAARKRLDSTPHAERLFNNWSELNWISWSMWYHYLKYLSCGIMFTIIGMSLVPPQKPANILVMGEGPERGRVKIGMYILSFSIIYCLSVLLLCSLQCLSCSGHGVCPSVQFTAEAFSRSRPCGGHLLVQSTWTTAWGSTLHQSHRWELCNICK